MKNKMIKEVNELMGNYRAIDGQLYHYDNFTIDTKDKMLSLVAFPPTKAIYYTLVGIVTTHGYDIGMLDADGNIHSFSTDTAYPFSNN